MQGKIKAYSPSVNAGLVHGIDGQNYPFNRSQWSGENLPQNNQAVKIERSGERLLKVMPHQLEQERR
jgi:hypothetical protein